MQLGHNIGSVTADCRVCKKCTKTVSGVDWHKSSAGCISNLTSEKTVEDVERILRPGRATAYLCTERDKWIISPNCDQSCCVLDRKKIIGWFAINIQRWKKKLDFMYNNPELYK